MHSTISGTVDFHEKDDESCLARLRSLIAMLPDRPAQKIGCDPARDPMDVYKIVSADGRGEYDVRDLLSCIVDAESFQEFRPDYARTLVTGYALINGVSVGIVANQRCRTKTSQGELQIGGVLYGDAAEKAARFVKDCNQTRIPLVFFQDVQGFMVGKQAEQSGIIRSGAEFVYAMSVATVPKFTVIVGSAYGAGNYAMCGRAYDPSLILAWPNARCAVMGGNQAADTMLTLRIREAEKSGRPLSPEAVNELRETIRQQYEEQTDIRYAAARGWVDAIIPPNNTRLWLSAALSIVPQTAPAAHPSHAREI